jgi:hypothetical protein
MIQSTTEDAKTPSAPGLFGLWGAESGKGCGGFLFPIGKICERFARHVSRKFRLGNREVLGSGMNHKLGVQHPSGQGIRQ